MDMAKIITLDSLPVVSESLGESMASLEERPAKQANKFSEITRVGALVTSLLADVR